MKCKIITTNELGIPKFEDFKIEIDNDSIPLIDNFIWVLVGGISLYRLSPYRTTTTYVGILKPSVTSLTFDTLRKANIARLPEFKNSKGEPAHSKSDGSDWSPAQWLQAVIGELGEYANVMKKVERGDLTFEEAKPLIEKELADVMTYLDILAFRVGIDLSKAVEEKFNEVSERVGCSLRIENNEVVRKLPQITKKEILASRTMEVEEFKLPVTVTNKELREAVDKLGSGELTRFSINNRKSYVSETKEELQQEAKIKENVRARIQSGRTKCGTSIFENYDYNPKNGELTPKLTNEELKTYNKACGTITNITVQTTNSVINEDVTLSINMDDEIKVSIKPKMTDEEFKAAKEACRIPKEQREQLFAKKSFSSDISGALNEMIRWKLFKNYAEIYPLKIPHNAIDDVYSFEFQGIDNGKQYLFYHAKRIFLAKNNMNLRVVAIAQSNIFSFFSKQLGTKIVGMLINGHKENKILNPNDTVQFYDERNVLYNFRLIKSSDKNVEVSAT